MVLRSISIKNYPWLLLSIIVSGIIQAVYGNLQLLGYFASNHSGFKMTGSFFNPGPYAGFLVSVWTIALGIYLFKDYITTQIQSKKKNNYLFLNKVIKSIFEYIPLLGLISIAIVLPATQSRASWIAAILGSAVLIELKYRFLSNLFKKVTLKLQKTALIVLAIGILITGFFSIYHYKKVSSDGRAFIWKVTAEMIADAPVFGVGFDQFKAKYMDYQANYFAKNGETTEAQVADNSYYAFNEGLQFVTENGLLGFALLLIVVYVLFLTKVKQEYQLNAAIAKTGLLTIGIFACFSYPMQILPIKLVLVLLLALLSNSAADCFRFKTKDNPIKIGIYKIQFVLLTYGIIYSTFSFTNKLNEGFITWNNALISYQYGDYKKAILAFETAYPIFKKDGDFLMNYGKTLSIAREPDKAITILEQAQHYQNNTVIATALGDSYKEIKQYKKAEASYQQAVNMTPAKFYANYLLAKLYDTSGQEDKAIIMVKKIMDKEVKIPSTAIKEIRREMKKILIKYKNPPGF
ncbi:O-antigen ligase family protein [Flavobacterium undicola]|uniref:O-antigen ligase family protein n=1 Tax=Flavobacterium undicola TaxID=1932779 RepID=UPI0013774E20|nr:O-antigen ligase family protein [Flavobacterium undicola]MBA0884775.1 O-antigen ligase family protein [Flavobacterium undicola]